MSRCDPFEIVLACQDVTPLKLSVCGGDGKSRRISLSADDNPVQWESRQCSDKW
jgi:hypothetical protein